MNDLVVIENDVPLVSTILLFKKMGYGEHRALKKVVESNLVDFEGYGVVRFQMHKPNAKGGRPEKGYLLNEEQFILLAMMIRNTPEAIKLKVRIAKEFNRMKRAMAKLAVQRSKPEWQNLRVDGKTVYMQKTDVIKKFVEYATGQGSKSAFRYYTSLATMQNKALLVIDGKYKNVREVMTTKQLMMISTADDVIERALQEGMAQGLPYKKIYILARDRMNAFSGIVGKTQLNDLALESN